MNITQINFLLTLKNATLKNKTKITFSYNSKFIKLATLFYNEGLILSFDINKKANNMTIFLKNALCLKTFQSLKIISHKSNIKIIKFSDLCKISTNQRYFFISTVQGIMTANQCKKERLGGSLLFIC